MHRVCNTPSSPILVAETNPSGKFPQLIHGGDASLHVGHQQDPWIGGLKQSVTVPANAQLRFCAWSRLYANNVNYRQRAVSK